MCCLPRRRQADGRLDLRSLEAMLKGSVNGAVAVEGFSERSVLVRRVANRRMPPPGSGEPLSEVQIQNIRSGLIKGILWIRQSLRNTERTRVHKSGGSGYQCKGP